MFIPVPKGPIFKGRFITPASSTWASQSTIDAAIHQQGLAGYVRGAFRGQPDNDIRDLFGTGQALYWNFRRPALVDLFRGDTGGQGACPSQFLQALCGRISWGHRSEERRVG